MAALIVIVGISQSAGTSYNTSFSLPHTGSQDAVNLLQQDFKKASGESDQIVLKATGGSSIASPAVKSAATKMLDKVAALPKIASVASPYAAGGQAQVSKNGKVAFATVVWKERPADVTKTQATQLINTAQAGQSSHLDVYLGGNSIENAQSAGTGPSVLVGVIAALIIMLITFGGAFLSSAMPLLTAGIALGTGTALIGLFSHAFSMPSVSVDLAVLIGLGVGVDYGLFIISRHRQGVKEGLSYEDAAAQAVQTSGRTVLFAGMTVCIALLGQFALGVSFLYGLSVASTIAVALTMATSLTFLPAMLGFLGPRVLSRRERRALEAGAVPTANGFWERWAAVVQRQRAVVAIVSLIIVALIAVPFFTIRLGSSDAGTDKPGETTRLAYDTLAGAFGPGFNGPLQLVAKVNNATGKQEFAQLVSTLSHAPGVAAGTAPIASPTGKAELALLYPTTSPQSVETVNLVNHLRNTVIPAAQGSSKNMQVLVGGATATNIDFSHVLSKKLPLFIGIVVVLAFLLLMVVFRSLLIPLVASAMNLLSVGAALGALHAVFTWGWGASILGVGTGPIDAWLPVLMFSVLFGLSMDYEVYLVSRIHEEWVRRRGSFESPRVRNDEAVHDGQAKSGRIVAAAAAIMILVFGSFIIGGQRSLAEFGFGLGFSVLVDAFVIRSALVPALMHLIGPANFAFPKALDRLLPNIDIEGEQNLATEDLG